jgi:non-canonical purine NTP pyrophosphatase (RdgB/HAM1 family)
MKEIDVTFVTGSPKKAEYLAKLLGFTIKHQKVDLHEPQSLNLREITEYKARHAYEIIKAPVLVEDVSLEFESLNGLPGTFIKFFIDTVPLEKICRMISDGNRKALARCVFAYFDGSDITFFEAAYPGMIAQEPRGGNGYGYDKILIPEGYTITRAEMTPEQNLETYLKVKPIAEVAEFLSKI